LPSDYGFRQVRGVLRKCCQNKPVIWTGLMVEEEKLSKKALDLDRFDAEGGKAVRKARDLDRFDGERGKAVKKRP
jgi:hypothetical protein